MYRTILKIDGMMCGMCESHICDVIRKTVPSAKKVTASRRQKEASFVHDGEVSPDLLKNAVNETGYTCTEVVSEPYTKKGWFFG